MRDLKFGGHTKAARPGPGLRVPTVKSLLNDIRRLAGVMPPMPRTPTFEIARAGIADPDLAGFRIVEDPNLVDVVEDWSEVRSPSRAARRRRQGHPQRIRYRTVPRPTVYTIGNTMVMHPDTARRMRERVRDGVERAQERRMMDALLGITPYGG